MGTDSRTYSIIINKLKRDAQLFDFFQAVRLCEISNSEKPRIGCSRKNTDDILRFGQTPTLSFPPTSISDFITDARHPLPILYVYFFGLLGPNGAFPPHFTEFIRNRERNYGDPTQSRFLDIFHNRMIALFYRACVLNDQALSYDRPDNDLIGFTIACLSGIGYSTLKKRDSLCDTAKQFWAGRLIVQQQPMEGLASLLSGFFEMPVYIDPFTPLWIKIPKEYLCKLGDGYNCQLGASLIIGSRCYERVQNFTVRVGPLKLNDFERILPDKPGFKKILDWIKNYLKDPLTVILNYILKADEVPNIKLGKYGKLGYSTWLKTKDFTKDASDFRKIIL